MKNKYAICLLAFTNDVYLVGAAIAGFVHRQYIKKYKLDIDVVLMIDNTFEPYISELEKIFDKVKIIKLIEIKLSPQYKIHHKYSKWLKYSINKWQVLNFDEYEKVLFCDSDVVPLYDFWYNDLFNLQAPAFLSKGLAGNYGSNITQDMVTNKNIQTQEDYRVSSKDFKFTIDAGLVLLKPSKNLYLEYLDFIKFVEGTEGYISSNISGADETTLLLFTLFYKKIPSVFIPYDYSVISWEGHPYEKQNVKGLNFLSMIKPWVKPSIAQWSDERLWHDFGVALFKKHQFKSIEKVYLKLQLENLFKYAHAIRFELFMKVAYNYEAFTTKSLQHRTQSYLHYLSKIRNNNFSYSDTILVLSKANIISENMYQETAIDQTSVKNIVCS